MRTTIEIFGTGSLVGMLVAVVAALVAMIWDADFVVRLGASAFVVFVALFVAAVVATNSPLYKD